MCCVSLVKTLDYVVSVSPPPASSKERLASRETDKLDGLMFVCPSGKNV